MTLAVHVEVPADAEWTAEVTTVERTADGRVRAVWSDTLSAGESRFFHPHERGSIFVAEGRRDGANSGHANLVATFAFGLGQAVTLIGSDEAGTVIGRSDHAESARSYLVRYRAADGRLTEAWWGEMAIAAPASPSPISSAQQA